MSIPIAVVFLKKLKNPSIFKGLTAVEKIFFIFSSSSLLFPSIKTIIVTKRSDHIFTFPVKYVIKI